MLRQYQKQEPSFLTQQTPQELHTMIQEADHAYFNTDCPLLTDEPYDQLREFAGATIQKIGHPPDSKKVPLPVYMSSLDKMKTKDQLQRSTVPTTRWCKCSHSKKRKKVQLYSRGQELTLLFPHLVTLFSHVTDCMFVTRTTWSQHFNNQGNPRNIVTSHAPPAVIANYLS